MTHHQHQLGAGQQRRRHGDVIGGHAQPVHAGIDMQRRRAAPGVPPGRDLLQAAQHRHQIVRHQGRDRARHGAIQHEDAGLRAQCPQGDGFLQPPQFEVGIRQRVFTRSVIPDRRPVPERFLERFYRLCGAPALQSYLTTQKIEPSLSDSGSAVRVVRKLYQDLLFQPLCFGQVAAL